MSSKLKKVRLDQRWTRTNVGLVQTSDWYKRRTVQTSDQYKRQTSANVGLRKKIIWTIKLKKKLFPFIDWSNKNLPKGTEFLPLTQIFSSLYLCNLVMILTFNTFKLKLFDLKDFIGWNIKGFTTSGCKDLGILKHQSM